eukprot:m.128690 g.128690  ORF g.128690 m.128690 type:complete len:87 (-) comp11244_c0_seq3:388-648(-)
MHHCESMREARRANERDRVRSKSDWEKGHCRETDMQSVRPRVGSTDSPSLSDLQPVHEGPTRRSQGGGQIVMRAVAQEALAQCGRG